MSIIAHTLALQAFHSHVENDKPIGLKTLRDLDNAESPYASLVEALARLKNGRKLKDAKAMFAAFRKSGELGLAYGNFYAGLCYAEGIGVRKNRRHAEKLYLQSAERGCICAMFALGKMYRLGDGVVQDTKRSLLYFRQAADARVAFAGTDDAIRSYVHSNDKEAQLLAMEQLGTLYWDPSYGVRRDIEEARYWFGRAERGGSLSAKEALKDIPPHQPIDRGQKVPPPPPIKGPGCGPGPKNGGNINGYGREQAYLLGQRHVSMERADLQRAARFFFIAHQLGHRQAQRELDAIKAEVGEQAYAAFFRIWNSTHHP